jgi:hypothetical protein
MAANEDSVARIKLVWRIMRQRMLGDSYPVLLSEIAELRFLAESDDERAMSDEDLARAVLNRECRRMGFDPATFGRGLQRPGLE